MADDFYNAPGAAASAGINDFLTQQAAQRRQAMLDALAVRKQSFEEDKYNREMDMKQQQHAMDLELKKSQMESLAAERMATVEQKKDAIREKQVADLKNRFANMVPGDIPDAEMLQGADKLGLGGQAFPKPPLQQQSMPGVVAPQFAPPALRIAPAPVSTPGVGPNAGTTLPPSPEPPAQMGLTGTSDSAVRPYVGNRQDREKATSDTELDNYINSLPEGPIKQVAMAKRHGVTVTAGDLKLDNPAGGGRLLAFDPIRGTLIDSATKQPVTDYRPTDKVERMAEPRDTSARDAAHEMAQERLMEQVRQHAYTTFDQVAKPYEEEIRNVQKLSTVMNQNSNVADATIAEQVLKMTAGGAGSGLRLTQPLIDQILKGSRSKWDDLSQALKKWGGGDPKDLILTPDQKESIRKLGKAVLDRATTIHKQILDARTQVDNPTADAPTVHKAVTDLKRGLDEGDTTPASTTPANVIRYDMNGKVIK